MNGQTGEHNSEATFRVQTQYTVFVFCALFLKGTRQDTLKHQQSKLVVPTKHNVLLLHTFFSIYQLPTQQIKIDINKSRVQYNLATRRVRICTSSATTSTQRIDNAS